MSFKQTTHLFVLLFNMMKVLLSGVEIMLILSAVVTSVAENKKMLSYYFCIILACSVKNLILRSILTLYLIF